ncbi:MAG: ATP-dependent zinc metalloprotease FtsH [Kiritimatiellaeota bacterium]|nr:ATP-dependent zinc metalloprotease FtsH [Kiritimatiellota bacterium]
MEKKEQNDLSNNPPPLSAPTKEREDEEKVAGGALPPKGLLAWLVLALLALTMVAMLLMKQENTVKVIDRVEIERLVSGEGLIEQVEWVTDSVSGRTYVSGKFTDEKKKSFRFNLPPGENQNIKNLLDEHKVPYMVVTRGNVLLMLLGSPLLVLALILGGTLFILRQFKNANSGAMNFGKGRAKMLSQDKKKVTFANVAGITEAKEEVQEIVEFLKDPKKFQALGGRIPKGVLLMGPPGTGKTLLAKAIAGEAGVPFFSISGSDFVEMFVGVGASRVRDMFDQGKKHAPCLIFIDEIDAVGRNRFSGLGGGHDEREQTLNALLVEMDGFETSEGVIILAATNRSDVLDPALLRSGRFDRQIVVDMPTLTDREEILRLHAVKVTFAPDADLSRVARGTPGFSGADLANLLNEAALLAARGNKQAVEHIDLEEARDKVLWGRERRSRAMDEKERRTTAWHEAGHAVLQVLCEHTEPLHKVTIIPRGQALGATMALPKKDVLNRTRNQLLDMLVVFAGGRIAEELYTGDISTGAQMDIKMASEIAHEMVCAYGMSDAFGFQSFGSKQETLFLGREVTRNQAYSEETARRIDAEVSRLMSDAYARAKQMIDENRDKLEILVTQLMERETMDGREVEELLKPQAEPANEDGENMAVPGQAD